MRKFVLFFLLLISFNAQAKFQGQALVDSLLNALPNSKEDTNKVNLLAKLSYSYYGISIEEGLKYGKQGLELATHLGWQKGIAINHNSIGVLLDSKGDYTGALTEHAASGKILTELKESLLLTNSMVNTGLVFLHLGKYQEALNKFSEALELKTKVTHEKGDYSIYNNMGLAYEKMSNYPEALKMHYAALRINEENDNKRGVASSYNNIGLIYMNLGKYDDALKSHFASLKINQDLKIKTGVANSYNNIGTIYYFQKKYTEALKYFNSALQSRIELGEIADIGDAHSNIAGVYQKLDSLDQAISHYQSSLKIYEEIGDKNGVAATNNNIGVVYVQQKRFEEAGPFLNKGMVLAKEMGSLDLLCDASKGLSEIYEHKGQFEKSLENYKLWVTTKDSIFNQENTKKTIQTQLQYDFEKKEAETKLEHEKKLNDQKSTTLLIFIALIIVVAIAVMLILRSRYKSRIQAQTEAANKQLAADKDRLDELNHLQQDLLVQKDALMEELGVAAEMKSKFLANISHELRTPVTLLTGMLEMLRDKSAGNTDKLDIALNNSRRLKFMIEEILDLSRMESNEAKLKLENKEVAPLLKRIVYAFETFIQKQELSLTFNDSKANGLYAQLDEDKFEKIINNLVYNAVKFNKRGGNISVQAYSSVANNELIIKVEDTGTGIQSADLPHIFDRFYQGESTNKSGGVGIGLSLVKEFTSLMGGRVEVTSVPGNGAVFTLYFPLAEKEVKINEVYEEIIQLPAEEWGHFAVKQTVLIVEDNVEMRYYLKEILGDNVKILEAPNGAMALKLLESTTVDLIISDIMMPEMDGREFIARLKSTENLKKIPVISLSALADQESQLGMLRLGVDDYIVKPFNADELRVRVYNLLNNYAERKSFNEQPAESEDIAVSNKEADELRTKIAVYVLARLKNVNVSVQDLASELALSERQLYRLTKSLTGCSPAQLIKEVRLQKAYELLLTGKITKIEDVANRVGFESPGYFSRQFLERFGKRPTEFL